MEHESYYHSLEVRKTESRRISEDDPDYSELRLKALESSSAETLLAISEMKTYLAFLKNAESAQERLQNTKARYEEECKAIREHDQGIDFAGRSQQLLDNWKQNLVSAEQKYLFWQNELEKKANILKDIMAELATEYLLIKKSSAYGKQIAFVEQELRAMFGGAGEILSDADAHEEKNKVNNLVNSLRDRTLPSEIIFHALENHEKNMQERQKNAEKLMVQVKNDFIEELENGVADGWLVGIDLNKIKRRMDFVRIQVVDRLREPFSEVAARHASSGMIFVYSDRLVDIDFPALRKSIMHELVHEISGNSMKFNIESIRVEQEFVPDSQNTFTAIENKKSGFMLYDSSSVTMARYEWFNEAVTEWLALRLSRFNNGQNDSFSSFKGSTKYTKERRWLDDLFLLGLEEEFVIRALFENIDQDDDASLEKSEFFVKLKQRVGELKRDPEAFERLDNQFKLESFTRLLPWPVQEKDHGLNYNTSLPNGTRVFDLSLRFGSEKSTASRDMIISLWPDNDGYSSEDKYVQITQALDDLVKKYPSFIYTISKPFTVNNPRFEL